MEDELQINEEKNSLFRWKKKFVDRMLKANYALEWHSNFERTQV